MALIAGWRSLGQAIDLDEIQEKMDYERRLRQQPQNCTWSECKYHSEKPPVTLQACKGCGEAVRIPLLDAYGLSLIPKDSGIARALVKVGMYQCLKFHITAQVLTGSIVQGLEGW